MARTSIKNFDSSISRTLCTRNMAKQPVRILLISVSWISWKINAFIFPSGDMYLTFVICNEIIDGIPNRLCVHSDCWFLLFVAYYCNLTASREKCIHWYSIPFNLPPVLSSLLDLFVFAGFFTEICSSRLQPLIFSERSLWAHPTVRNAGFSVVFKRDMFVFDLSIWITMLGSDGVERKTFLQGVRCRFPFSCFAS